MSNTAQEVVDLAKNYLGTTDGSPFVKRYNDRTGMGLPPDCSWCACFVSDIMRMCGVPQESVKDYKGCATGVECFTLQGRFKSRRSGFKPKPGDIIFYEMLQYIIKPARGTAGSPRWKTSRITRATLAIPSAG